MREVTPRLQQTPRENGPAEREGPQPSSLARYAGIGQAEGLLRAPRRAFTRGTSPHPLPAYGRGGKSRPSRTKPDIEHRRPARLSWRTVWARGPVTVRGWACIRVSASFGAVHSHASTSRVARVVVVVR